MSILTRNEAIRAIGKGLTGTPTADQLLTVDEMVDAVDVVLEGEVGPIELMSVTWRGRRQFGPLLLPWRYVGIASVTVDGVAVPAEQYDASLGADQGMLWPAVGYAPWAYCSSVVVVATVGAAGTPANLRLAAMTLIRSWWQTSQMGGRPADDDALPFARRAIPVEVTGLLSATPNLPGFG